MKAKKLHTDECYVCIISFILFCFGIDLGLDLDSAGLVNITDLL